VYGVSIRDCTCHIIRRLWRLYSISVRSDHAALIIGVVVLRIVLYGCMTLDFACLGAVRFLYYTFRFCFSFASVSLLVRFPINVFSLDAYFFSASLSAYRITVSNDLVASYVSFDISYGMVGVCSMKLPLKTSIVRAGQISPNLTANVAQS
jgi:hypothetical protein